MGKISTFLSLLFCAVFLHGGALEVNGNFARLDKTGKPVNWRVNQWAGYKPFAKYEVVEEAGRKVLHISNVTARSGFGWFYGKQFKAVAGDTINVSARVRGKGTANFGLQFRDAKGNYMSYTNKGGSFKLTSEWKVVNLALKVVNTSRGETSLVTLTLSGGKGCELFISDISAHSESEESDIAGSAPFPREWLLFAPVDPALAVATDVIPEAINGVKGDRTLLAGSRNELEFSKYFPGRKIRNTGWAFAEMTAPGAEQHTIGVGADYFFALYVNGKEVLSTLEKGNAAGNPPHFNNYTVTVPLKKGKNILAVKFQSGSGKKMTLCIGGANDLRALSGTLAITKYIEKDDYEAAADRPGNPKLIRDIVSPGWLTVSGHGVYGAGSVNLSKNSAQLPPAASGLYLAAGLRIKTFNGEKVSFALGKIAAELKAQGNNWQLTLLENGKKLKSISLPPTALPGDLTLACTPKNVLCSVSSLGDNKLRSITAKVTVSEKAPQAVALDVIGKDAELVADNYFLGIASPETKSSDIPLKVDLLAEFDPVKAKWPLVWSDEFDGEKVDLENKWFIPSWTKTARTDLLVIKDGILHLRCEKAPGQKRPQSVGIRSRQMFQFGYFEARVRFTKHPGWWAAFWLLANGGNMTTAGGSEIDVFEDYATRRADRMIANNYHTFMGSKIKSFGYNFFLPGSIDDFYVIGCKWTPFEISIYLNGKLVKSSASHSPWQSLTYDAVNHAFPTSPNRVIISGQCGSSGGRATEPFVEEYLVDYVRVYAYPQDDLPRLKWGKTPAKQIVRTGEVLKFSADVKPAAKSKAAITGVYLFDNGYLVDFKSAAPYEFELPLTQARYDMSPWATQGKSSAAPKLDGYPHFYQLAVQDARGKVAITDPLAIINIDKESQPYQNKYIELPGTLPAGSMDEGEANVAFYKSAGAKTPPSRKRVHLVFDGAWIRYSVDVKSAGKYQATLHRSNVRDITRGKNFYPDMQFWVFVNDKLAGKFICKKGETSTVLKDLELPAGKAKLTFMPIGGAEIAFKSIDFVMQK